MGQDVGERAAASRYTVPGDVVLFLAVSVSEAFDGLKLAALAIGEEDHAATHTSLRYLYSRLDVIHEALLAIVGEHEGSEDGSPRPC